MSPVLKSARGKKRLEQVAQSQMGAIDRFVVRESQTSTQHQTLHSDGDGNHRDNTDNVEVHTSVVDSEPINPNIVEAHTFETNAENTDGIDSESIPFQPDIFDPRYWDSLDQKMVDILVQKGPRRDLSIQKGPKDRLSRRFTATLYSRVLSNREKCDREWLVYSKEPDRVFCFCCKVLRKSHSKSQLANEGFNDWSHVHQRLKEHETSAEHITNMATWY